MGSSVYGRSDMIWHILYPDGRKISEWVQDKRGRWVETSWSALQLDQVMRVWLEGDGLILGYWTDAGVIVVRESRDRGRGQPLEISMGGSEAGAEWREPLTDRPGVDYRPVQYKDAYSAISPPTTTSARQPEGILQYNLGWTMSTVSRRLGRVSAALTAHIPTNGDPVHFSLLLKSDRDIQGTLYMTYGGVSVPMGTQLDANKLYEMSFRT